MSRALAVPCRWGFFLSVRSKDGFRQTEPRKKECGRFAQYTTRATDEGRKKDLDRTETFRERAVFKMTPSICAVVFLITSVGIVHFGSVLVGFHAYHFFLD